MNKKTVKDIDLKKRIVIMRVDYNVPLDDKHEVTDKTRIEASLETVNYILKKQDAKANPNKPSWKTKGASKSRSLVFRPVNPLVIIPKDLAWG